MKLKSKSLLLLSVLILCSCGGNKTRKDTEGSIEAHNYVKAEELTLLKDVNSTKIINYFEKNSNSKIYKENLSITDEEASVWFNEVCTDDSFYYWMYDGYQNNGRIISLREIWFFPKAEIFVLKNQTNKYDYTTVNGYDFAFKYQNTAETAFRIGMKANQPVYGGTYYQECLNLTKISVEGYLVNMTFTIPVFEPPSKLPEINKVNCIWNIADATDISVANSAFKSDQNRLCAKSYDCLTGVYHYLNTKISEIDSTYKLFSN